MTFKNYTIHRTTRLNSLRVKENSSSALFRLLAEHFNRKNSNVLTSSRERDILLRSPIDPWLLIGPCSSSFSSFFKLLLQLNPARTALIVQFIAFSPMTKEKRRLRNKMNKKKGEEKEKIVQRGDWSGCGHFANNLGLRLKSREQSLRKQGLLAGRTWQWNRAGSSRLYIFTGNNELDYLRASTSYLLLSFFSLSLSPPSSSNYLHLLLFRFFFSFPSLGSFLFGCN